MKKLIYLIFTCLGLASCTKDSFVSNFDEKPEERMSESIALVKNQLTSSANGWVATLPTNAGGGYSFYMKFDTNEDLTMFGDLNAATATTSLKSTYRVKAGLGANLIFDTYSYLAMLTDPNSTVFGGVQGTGYKSDVEFTYVRSTTDSIFFVGKSYRQPLAMVKATAAQKIAYEAGELKNSADKLTAFFANTKNPYIEIGTGTNLLKVVVSTNFTNVLASGKRIELSALKDNVVISSKGKFGIGIDGFMITAGGLTFEGITFVKAAWKDATTLALYDSNNKEYIIKSNPVPIIPLYLSFGFQSTFPYKRISISSTGLPAGVTSGFTAVYNQMLSLFATSGRSVTSTNFILKSNSVFTVEVNYLSGTTAFVASADYNYTKVGDIITLDNNPIGNVNWPTRAVQIKPLADYMLTGPFKIDWVSSTNPSVGTLGGLYRTNDLTSFIYGSLL
ncbi:DUF4302 domain-containing protein [Nubsella zeaxanthinifaciens]|uniref:DUF4302 domain-containing protein n=1 Tax=Nubsella zeaxanthinifaciens TaxID=392412 RepID=UPI003D05A13F